MHVNNVYSLLIIIIIFILANFWPAADFNIKRNRLHFFLASLYYYGAIAFSFSFSLLTRFICRKNLITTLRRRRKQIVSFTEPLMRWNNFCIVSNETFHLIYYACMRSRSRKERTNKQRWFAMCFFRFFHFVVFSAPRQKQKTNSHIHESNLFEPKQVC